MALHSQKCGNFWRRSELSQLGWSGAGPQTPRSCPHPTGHTGGPIAETGQPPCQGVLFKPFVADLDAHRRSVFPVSSDRRILQGCPGVWYLARCPYWWVAFPLVNKAAKGGRTHPPARRCCPTRWCLLPRSVANCVPPTTHTHRHTHNSSFLCSWLCAP